MKHAMLYPAQLLAAAPTPAARAQLVALMRDDRVAGIAAFQGDDGPRFAAFPEGQPRRFTRGDRVLGIWIRDRPMSRTARAVQLVSQGATQLEAARLAGVSESAVSRALTRERIKFRRAERMRGDV